MSFFINRATVEGDPNQVLGTEDTPDATWTANGGLLFEPVTGAVAITQDTPPATGDAFVGGLLLNALGQLYVWNFDTLGLPDQVAFNMGFPVTEDGALIVTGDDPLVWQNGWPIAANSFVCMDTGEVPPVVVTISHITIEFPIGL